MRTCQAMFPSDDCMSCCDRTATNAVGHLVLCDDHTQQALSGMLEYDGREASEVVKQGVTANPATFPKGVFPWSDGLTAEPVA